MPAHGQSKKKEKGEGVKSRKKPAKKPPVAAEPSEKEDSDDEKKSQGDDSDAFKIKYVAYNYPCGPAYV